MENDTRISSKQLHIKSNQIKTLYDSQENEYISLVQLNQHASSVSNTKEFIFLRNQTKHNQISTKEIHSFENQINPSNSFSFYSFYFPSKQTEHNKLNKTKTLAKKEETHFPSLIPALTQQPNRAKSTATNEEK